jgi:3-(3-hydroxy-phenyl)propionate hydroxylase
MNTGDFDVAVVGAGPTGLTLCNLLGQAGLRVVLIERNPTTVVLPRAVSIDDESLRTMQATGLLPAMLKDIALDYGSHYFTPGGEVFLKVEPATREFGHPRRNAFLQPTLEAQLRDGLCRFANVATWFDTSCEAVDEQQDHVTLTLLTKAGETKTIRARYVAGTDGGRSMIRKAIGANLQGSTYQQRWLIVDLAETVEQFRQTRVLCNKARSAICLPGPHGTRRYEFTLADDETEELATSDAFVRGLLAAHGPDRDARIVRQQVYTFHARMVDRWATDRIFLAGDAAHLTPPFAGQGMNSGVRDAHNLAWKLIEVVSGRLGHRLLASYARERPSHAWALIQLAVTMGKVMMPTSPLQGWLVQSAFRLAGRLPRLQSYFAEMKYKPKPRYQAGFFRQDLGSEILGRMVPQPLLDMADGSVRLMDDVIGNGFTVLAYGPQAQDLARQVAAMDIGLPDRTLIAVTPRRWNPERHADSFPVGRDIEDRLAPLAPDGGNGLLLLRPDRYIAVATRIDGPGQIAAFAADIRALVTATWATGD